MNALLYAVGDESEDIFTSFTFYDDTDQKMTKLMTRLFKSIVTLAAAQTHGTIIIWRRYKINQRTHQKMTKLMTRLFKSIVTLAAAQTHSTIIIWRRYKINQRTQIPLNFPVSKEIASSTIPYIMA